MKTIPTWIYFVILGILGIIVTLFLFKKENYQLQIGGQPDDIWLYQILPFSNFEELTKFAQASPESRRLVNKFLTQNRFPSPFNNINLLSSLLYFEEENRNKEISQILRGIFNTISPNSSKFFTFQNQEVLVTNKSLLPPILITNRFIEELFGNLYLDTNMAIFIKTDRRLPKRIRSVSIYIKRDTNDEIEENLLNFIRENLSNANLIRERLANSLITSIGFTGQRFNVFNYPNENDFLENNEKFQMGKRRAYGLMFTLEIRPNVNVYEYIQGYNRFIKPMIENKEEEKERVEEEEEKINEIEEDEVEENIIPPTDEQIGKFLSILQMLNRYPTKYKSFISGLEKIIPNKRKKYELINLISKLQDLLTYKPDNPLKKYYVDEAYKIIQKKSRIFDYKLLEALINFA